MNPTHHTEKAAHLRRNAALVRERWPNYPSLAQTLDEWAAWHEEEAKSQPEKPRQPHDSLVQNPD